MNFHAPCGVVLYFVVCKLYTDKEKRIKYIYLIYCHNSHMWLLQDFICSVQLGASANIINFFNVEHKKITKEDYQIKSNYNTKIQIR